MGIEMPTLHKQVSDTPKQTHFGGCRIEFWGYRWRCSNRFQISAVEDPETSKGNIKFYSLSSCASPRYPNHPVVVESPLKKSLFSPFLSSPCPILHGCCGLFLCSYSHWFKLARAPPPSWISTTFPTTSPP